MKMYTKKEHFFRKYINDLFFKMENPLENIFFKLILIFLRSKKFIKIF